MSGFRLVWSGPEPTLAGRRILRRLGLSDDVTGELVFADGSVIRFELGPDGFDRLRLDDGLASPAGIGVRSLPVAVAAVGIAYPVLPDEVDLAHAVDEPELGARGVAVSAGGRPLVLLEPTTEGRLAAFLARFDRGPCALYLRRSEAASSSRATLVPGGPPFGPFLLLRYSY